jgi:hypothetical protein
MEWDNELPDAVEPDDMPAAPLLTGGHTRRSGPRPLVILLPILLVIALAAGAAALAGVFSSNSGSAAVEKPPAAHVQAPVTTPLPIKIKKHSATTGAASGSASSARTSAQPGNTTAADGTAATGPTDATGTTP